MPGNGYDPGTVTMAVLALASLGAYQFPAAFFEQTDHVADLHWLVPVTAEGNWRGRRDSNPPLTNENSNICGVDPL